MNFLSDQLIFNLKNANDEISFQVPGNRTHNVTAVVIFEVKRGTEKYQNKREILAIVNPTYTLRATELLTNLQENKVLKTSQLA